MLFSGKENVFMCLVVFQKMFLKIFSDVWLCSWKYHRKHIFYLLLTFSHIFSVTKRLYNITYSSKYKQNPEKIDQRDRDRRDRDWRDCDWCDRDRSGRHFARSRSQSTRSRDASIPIARRSKRRLRSVLPHQSVMSEARCVDRDHAKLRSWSALRMMRQSRSRSREDRPGDCDRDSDRWYCASRWCRRTVMLLSLSLSSIFQGRKYFEVKIEMENHFRCFGSQIWSTGNAFQFDQIWSNNQTPLFSEKSFPKSVWSRFKRSLSLEANL